MKVFANREIRNLFQAVLAVWAVALALTQGIVWHTTHVFSFGLLLVFLLLGGCLWGVLLRYFQRQSALLEQAVQQIQSCLDGNPDARLDCDREGELYRLFHSVNALAAVLSAHADNEQREKLFLKNTISATFSFFFSKTTEPASSRVILSRFCTSVSMRSNSCSDRSAN